MKTAIYLAGAMTGHPNLNFPAFHAAAATLRAAGHEVINPAELCPDLAMAWADAMRADIAALVTSCRAIALLPGWQRSKGASLEAAIAQALGMEIIYLPSTEEAPVPALSTGAVI